MIGYPDPQHAAGFGQGFKNGGANPVSGQVIGGGKSRRSGPDNGHFFFPCRQTRDLYIPGINLVRGESFEVSNGNGFIHLGSSAGVFAAMGADAAQNAGQGQLRHDNLEGFLIFSLAHHLHIALYVQSGRAGQSAGRFIRFLYGKGPRNGLSVFLEGGFSFNEALIIFAGQGNGTGFSAIAAGGTFVKINITRGLLNGNPEISFGTFNLFHCCAGDQVDVQMPADLDQFGGDDSHSAIIGGKSLVQFTHYPADG